MTVNLDEMRALVDRLNETAYQYYVLDNPTISDGEWDKMYDALVRMERETGVTPKRYLIDLRLEHAQSLLNAGYDTVAAVAEKVGFGDAKNFATAFKKRFGYPPSKQTYEP